MTFSEETLLFLEDAVKVALKSRDDYSDKVAAEVEQLLDLLRKPCLSAEQQRSVAELIDAERWDDARELLARLAEDFGHDAEVLRLRTMLDVLAGA